MKRVAFLKSEGTKALVFLFSLMLVGCSCTERARLSHKPVLEVNGHTLSVQNFADRLALELKDYDALQVKDEATLKRAKDKVSDDFIIETLSREYAKKNSIKVTQQEVDSEINQVRARYPDDLAFRRMLADENLPFDEWKSELETTLLEKKVRDQVGSQVPEPTDQEMKSYYDKQKTLFVRPARVQLREILTDKEDNARRILEELQKGKDFGKLAQEFSLAPDAPSGGKTAWIEKGALDVFDAAFKMSVGARSKVLKSAYGYHIFEVLKKEPEAHLSFQEAKAKIKTLLKEQKTQEAFMSWLQSALKASKVERDDKLIDSIQVTTRGS